MKYIGKKLFLQMIIGFFAGQVGICGMCVLGVAYFAAVFEKAKARLLLAFCVIAGMFFGNGIVRQHGHIVDAPYIRYAGKTENTHKDDSCGTYCSGNISYLRWTKAVYVSL